MTAERGTVQRRGEAQMFTSSVRGRPCCMQQRRRPAAQRLVRAALHGSGASNKEAGGVRRQRHAEEREKGGGGTSMAPQPRPCGACRLLVASPAEGRNPSLFVPDVESGPSRRDESWAKSTAAPPRTTNRKDAVLWPVPASGDSPTERWEDERHGKRSRARSPRRPCAVCVGERAAAARRQRPDGG